MLALKKIDLKVPLVVRLAGTNVEVGRKILKDSGLPISCGRRFAWYSGPQKLDPYHFHLREILL